MINLPLKELKEMLMTKSEDNQLYIYDVIRKKYVKFLPEELVRQMLLLYLLEYVQYPKSRFQVEKGTITNEKKGRFDILIYDKKIAPWMLIECKSHKVQLDQNTIDQLGGYNTSINAPYLLISNGINSYCYKADHINKKYILLNSLPTFPS